MILEYLAKNISGYAKSNFRSSANLSYARKEFNHSPLRRFFHCYPSQFEGDSPLNFRVPILFPLLLLLHIAANDAVKNCIQVSLFFGNKRFACQLLLCFDFRPLYSATFLSISAVKSSRLCAFSNSASNSALAILVFFHYTSSPFYLYFVVHLFIFRY